MFVPFMPSRIEDACEPACYRIKRRDVRTFETIAIKARPRQISEDRFAVMFFSDDVIDFEWEKTMLFGE